MSGSIDSNEYPGERRSRYAVRGTSAAQRTLAIVGSLGLIVGLAGCGSGGGGSSNDTASTKRGYVISSFSYVYPEADGDACPGGFTKGPIEMRRDDGVALPDDCLDPESVSDPTFKTMNGPAHFSGLDIDGVISSSSSPGAGECPHDDFSGFSGEQGLDFQFWRAVGCIRGFQKGEISNSVVEEAVVNGSMTILIDLEDVDDETSDGQVTAQVFGSTDVPAIGADGEVLPFATLSIHENPQYHGGIGNGEIVDGVLLAGPMDINLRLNIQIVDGNQSLHDAYLRVEFLPDGTIRGQMMGYQPIVEAYDIFGVQAGPAGAAALSYTCTGLWDALKENADGHFDPTTGACTTISVAYRFEAVPAFVEKGSFEDDDAEPRP